MSPQKWKRTIKRELKRAGLPLEYVEVGGGRHYKFHVVTLTGPQTLVTGSTVSDCRALLKTRSQIKRLARGGAA